MEGKDEKLFSAVWKKALGFTSTECVEELTMQDGQLVLSKQKVTTKEVAPDIAAAKMILESMTDGLEHMSDEQLEAERLRLLECLKEGGCS